MRAWRAFLVICVLSLTACGDDDADPADGPPRVDGGVDGAVDGGGPPPVVENCAPADVVPCTPAAGTPGADGVILRGTIVGPDTLTCSGDVLYSKAQKQILCAGADCTGAAGAAGAPVVCADVISPGLIDAHEHMGYGHLPRFQHPALYDNREGWQNASAYDRFIDASRAVRTPMACEIGKWAEVRQILGGGTAVLGTQGGRAGCLGTLERDLDYDDAASHLGTPAIAFEFSVSLISASEATALRADMLAGIPLSVHIAEGVDSGWRDPEWEELVSKQLLTEATQIVHGTALSARQLGEMGTNLADLAWSPRSNIDLYGLTTPVTTAKHLGVSISLGTDWTPSGSMNILDELRCADHLNRTYYDSTFTDGELVSAVTLTPARAWYLDDKIGRVAVGNLADLTAYRGDREHPFRAIIDAEVDDVMLVVIGGEAIYGDSGAMAAVGEPSAFCEDLDVCGRGRRVCVKSAAGPGDPNRLDQTLPDIRAALEAALGAARTASGCAGAGCYMYDLMPLHECVPVDAAAACTLHRGAITGVPAAGDMDGDAVADVDDMCPRVFDPPFGGGATQEDADGDGAGDACDMCPLTVETVCPPPDATDLDGDGVKNAMDNCPRTPNLDQLDGDMDMLGDACDACPTDTDPACMTVGALRDPTAPGHPSGGLVTVKGVVVTAIKTAPASGKGIWVQERGATRFGGFHVFFGSSALPAAIVGQTVDVTGTYVEYFGVTELQSPTVTVVDATVLPLAPIAIADPATIATGGAMAEPLEGMLVSVGPVTVTSANPDGANDYDEFVVTGGLRVDDLITDGTNNLADGCAVTAVGAAYASITGVLHFSFANFKLAPRMQGECVP